MTATAGPCAEYVRFRSPEPDEQGRYIGVFGPVNRLARLTPEQERFRRAGNDWYNANVTNPSDIDPAVYDAARHPRAASWFKATATRETGRVPGYLRILAAHGVPCEEVRTTDPGRILYEDAEQVVAVPHGDGGDTPYGAGQASSISPSASASSSVTVNP